MNIEDCVFGVVDVETTGKDPLKDKVVEFAIVPTSVSRGPDIDGRSYSKMYNPGMEIPPSASAIHHITDEDVAGLIMFQDDPDPFWSSSHYVNVAHNAEFDSQFVHSPKSWVCTMRMAKKLYPEAGQYGNQFLRYYRKLIIPRHIADMSMHRALADAMVTAFVLLDELPELKRQHPEIETIQQLLDWLATPVLLHRVGFGKHGPKGDEPGLLWKDVPKSYLSWILEQDFDVDVEFTARHYFNGPSLF